MRDPDQPTQASSAPAPAPAAETGGGEAPTPLRLLLLEDSESDAALMEAELRQEGQTFVSRRVDTKEAFEEALEGFAPDVVLADFKVPRFGGMAALEVLRTRASGIPLVMVTGAVSEETVIECMKAGAADYVLKDHLHRLGPAVRAALERRRLMQARLSAESALRASEDQFRKLSRAVEQSPVSIVITDLQARIEYVNPYFCAVTGYAVDEVLGNNPRILKSGRVAAEVYAELWGRISSGQEWRGEFLNKKKNGELFWESAAILPVKDDEGRITHYMAIKEHITERKHAEQKLYEQARLLDLTPDAVMVFDMQDRVEFWNKGAEALTGFTSQDVMGRRATDLDCWGLGGYETARQRLLQDEEWQGEMTKFTRDRRKIFVNSRWRLVRNAAGQPQSILIIESDITEQKRIEQQLLQAQRMQSMGTLAGGITHDLNNILSPILMAAQVLRAEIKDEDVQTMLDTVENCAKRGADVVKQLLTFARGIQGERVSVQIRHLIKEIVHIAQETFPRSIKVTSNVPRELWPIVGDATQLHQVLLNLCVNARDAMPSGGTLSISAENVTLDDTFVSMEPEAKTGPHIMVCVRDTGGGIPPEIIDKIFEPFFTTKQTGKGTGLGLSTVLGIVRSHGGFVRTTSQVGQGATFKVFLPAMPGAQVSAAPGAKEELPAGAGETVLVVDDESGIRDSAAAILKQRGYQAIKASDGAEGLALFAQQRAEIRVVLTDIIMPFMDGVGLVRALRRIDPQVRVIATSGLMDDPDQGVKINELRTLSVRQFLTKPFTAEDLLFAIHRELTEVAAPGPAPESPAAPS